MKQYEEIAEAIRLSLPLVFPQQQFSTEEIAYMVLHFANSLEKNPKVMEVNIAGVSPSGLASISLLEMQLRKQFPFINKITFFRVGDIEQDKIESNYDLVISTSLLPGYRGKYKLVSPILLEEDIQELKEEFRLLSQKKRLSHAIPTPVSTREDTYEDVLAFIEEINRLLELFTLQTIDNGPNLEETLSEVMKHFSKALVQDRKK